MVQLGRERGRERDRRNMSLQTVASSVGTALKGSKSHLFPMSMMTMLVSAWSLNFFNPSLHTLVSHVLGYVVHEESTNCPTIIPIQREKERDRLRGTVREMKEREKEDLR